MAYPTHDSHDIFAPGAGQNKAIRSNAPIKLHRDKHAHFIHVSRNWALIQAAIDAATVTRLDLRCWTEPGLTARQAFDLLANRPRVASMARQWRFYATCYQTTGICKWTIFHRGGSEGATLEFTAPAPEEIVAAHNLRVACEKEKRALGRVGRRIKEEAAQAPVRRVPRL